MKRWGDKCEQLFSPDAAYWLLLTTAQTTKHLENIFLCEMWILKILIHGNA